MRPIPFKFSLLPGDLINALAGVKHACDATKNEAALFLGLNIEWSMADELKIGRSSPYTLTEDTMKFLTPLLRSQYYIESVNSLEEEKPLIYSGWCDAVASKDTELISRWYREHNDIIDLDRHHCFPIGLPYGNIFRSNFYMYPDMACDLSKPWLDIRTTPHNLIIVNRTLRCRNDSISYAFLRLFADHIVFVGLQEEYESFQREVGPCQHIVCKDALELARLIAGCRFFIGNQSLCFSIAEALKVPRILEICPGLPNVVPTGQDAFDFYYQEPFQYYVNKLYHG